MYLVWPLLNRLAVWTAQKAERPKEIESAIGRLVNELDLRTGTCRNLRPGPPSQF